MDKHEYEARGRARVRFLIEILVAVVTVGISVVALVLGCRADRLSLESLATARQANEIAQRQAHATEEPLRPSLEVERTVTESGEEITVRNRGRAVRWRECSVQCVVMVDVKCAAPYRKMRERLYVPVDNYYSVIEGPHPEDVWERCAAVQANTDRVLEQLQSANDDIATGALNDERFDVVPNARLVARVDVAYETELGRFARVFAVLGWGEQVQRSWESTALQIPVGDIGELDVGDPQAPTLSECLRVAVARWWNWRFAPWKELGLPGPGGGQASGSE